MDSNVVFGSLREAMNLGKSQEISRQDDSSKFTHYFKFIYSREISALGSVYSYSSDIISKRVTIKPRQNGSRTRQKNHVKVYTCTTPNLRTYRLSYVTK